MSAYLFAKKTEMEWAELIFNFGREVTEIGLKYISWSMLLAAIRLARIKSGSTELVIAESMVSLLLNCYLFSQLMRIDISVFSPERLTKRGHRMISAIVTIIIIIPIWWGSTMISNHTVQGLVDLQLPKESTTTPTP